MERLRRRTAAIVELTVHDLRPGAPFQEMRRIVDARCAAAKVPAPSRHALIAKIAEINRFQHAPNMLLLDHCVVETVHDGSTSTLSTLHVALLHPHAVPFAWRVIGGRASPIVDAQLLIEAQKMSGSFPDSRGQLAAGGSIAADISACLSAVHVDCVERTTRERGAEAKRVIDRLIQAPDALRLRASYVSRGTAWAAPDVIDALRSRLDRALAGLNGRIRQVPAFGLASQHHAQSLLNALRRIASPD